MACQSLSILTISTASSSSHSTLKSGKSLPSSSSVAFPLNLKPDWLVNSLLGNQFSFKLTNSRPSFHKQHCSALATISVSLPTAKPDKDSSEKAPKWSARAIKSFAMGELEARKLKYPNTGTEALLMGILVEGTSLAAKFLRANGVTLFKVRDETVKLLGKSDMYFFSPEHPPLTEPAQRALDYAVDEKLKSGSSGEITTTHLLLGIWSEKESAGHKIMETLGFNDEKAAELAKSKDEDYVHNYR
ncbi:Atp-dependent clp protease atp-binding subunit clpt1 protein [Thalictrum thalictroides]|uniref:Atp-dependent clp protease atp-binding subunit clpt1 protein n=1 Tax=Thalictrum thalictroides TaxID=46969 RepID=A0A7J6WTN2_THATH|nr:Atp-dependent clp protease atp-binding subunit clpt1 protein [Thalictrum thalictroides]